MLSVCLVCVSVAGNNLILILFAAITSEHIKSLFRLGLSLHAQKKYQEALPHLGTRAQCSTLHAARFHLYISIAFPVQALRLEPDNKSVKEAIHFAERRLAAQRKAAADK